MTSIMEQQCEIFSNYYPGLIERTVVVNPPTMFSLIYPNVKNHLKQSSKDAEFDTVTAEHRVADHLRNRCGIPIGSLPWEYGGLAQGLFIYEPLIFCPDSAGPKSSDPVPKKKSLKEKLKLKGKGAATASNHDDGHVHDNTTGRKGKQRRFDTIRSMFSTKSSSTQVNETSAGDNMMMPSGDTANDTTQPTMTPATAGNNQGKLPEISITADDTCAVESASTEPDPQSLADGNHAPMGSSSPNPTPNITNERFCRHCFAPSTCGKCDLCFHHCNC